MSGLILPQVVNGITNDELAELMAKALKEIDWVVNGNLSDQNISRIAGYIASKTELKHISGIVGMSGYDAANPLAVRFWSGNANKSIAPFRVNQAGQLFATDAFITGLITGSIIIGSEIKTAEDGIFPRAEMSSSNTLFAAYQSVDNFVKLGPDAFGSTPGFTFQNTESVVALIYLLNTPGVKSLFIGTPAGSADIDISSGKDLKLGGTNVSAYGAWTFPQMINGNITGHAASADYADHAGTAAAADELAPSGEIAWGQVLKDGSNVADLEVKNLASLTQNSSYRTVSDSEKSTWNGKLTAKMAQGTGTTGLETLDGIYYAKLTISYSGFSSPPKVHAHNTSVHTAWVSAITPITATSATIYLVSTLAGQVAAKDIEWTAIGT